MASRTKNTKRNIEVSFLYTGLKMIFQFVSRTIIIRYLGEEYLGLSSLYTSILQVLNMAELGFSSAIIYNMYKPIADHDVEAVCALLAYYKRIYRNIGLIIFVCGLILTPLIPFLIKGSYPENINLYIVFLLYLGNTVVSYFLFAYKTSLLEAMQRMDLSRITYIAASIIQYGLQIVALAVFRNFYLFTAIMIIGTAVTNIFSAYLAKKYFPEYTCRGELSVDAKHNIIRRVKGLMICNISSVTYTTFDSIIISGIMGLGLVAKYNNYITVMTGVTSIITVFRTAMQASVGNSVAKETVEKNYQDMLLWQFLFSGIAVFCASCMLCLYQPFMEIWMGHNMLLPFYNVIAIVVWFIVTVSQHSFFLYLSANGLWWELRKPYIFSTSCNLILNLVWGYYAGVIGIICASLFSSLVSGLFWQCTIIFKKYFCKTPYQFLGRQLVYFVLAIPVCVAAYVCTTLISIKGIYGLLIKGVTAAVVSGVILIILYCRTSIFRRAYRFALSVLKVK